MDSQLNPLRDLPAAQRFQVMLYLGVMWTTVFCAGAGAWFLYGELIMVHVLLVTGIIVTGLTFKSAKSHPTQRDVPLRDGTARYDDVWGA